MTNGYINIFVPDGRKIIAKLQRYKPGDGYFSGKLIDMQDLANCNRRCVELWNNDKLETVLVDIVWNGLRDFSDENCDYATVHLKWKE